MRSDERPNCMSRAAQDSVGRVWPRARSCRVGALSFDVGGKRPEPSRLRDVALCPVAVIAEESQVAAHVATPWVYPVYRGAGAERPLSPTLGHKHKRRSAAGTIWPMQRADVRQLDVER